MIPVRRVQVRSVSSTFALDFLFLLRDMFGNVCERYWLSSVGLAFFIDPLVPLFVSMNKITLDFFSEFRRPYQQAAPIAHRFQYKTRSEHQHVEFAFVHGRTVLGQTSRKCPIRE